MMSEAELRIERCNLHDAPAVAAFGRRMWVQTFGSEYSPDDLEPYLDGAFAVERISREMSDPLVRVLTMHDAQGAWCGYAMLRDTSENAPAGVVGAHPHEIVRFYIDEAWHGRGVAQMLMRECLADARAFGADTMWLITWQGAPRSQAFYKKVGFRKVGATTFRVGSRVDDDDILAMSLAESDETVSLRNV